MTSRSGRFDSATNTKPRTRTPKMQSRFRDALGRYVKKDSGAAVRAEVYEVKARRDARGRFAKSPEPGQERLTQKTVKTIPLSSQDFLVSKFDRKQWTPAQREKASLIPNANAYQSDSGVVLFSSQSDVQVTRNMERAPRAVRYECIIDGERRSVLVYLQGQYKQNLLTGKLTSGNWQDKLAIWEMNWIAQIDSYGEEEDPDTGESLSMEFESLGFRVWWD